MTRDPNVSRDTHTHSHNVSVTVSRWLGERTCMATVSNENVNE